MKVRKIKQVNQIKSKILCQKPLSVSKVLLHWLRTSSCKLYSPSLDIWKTSFRVRISAERQEELWVIGQGVFLLLVEVTFYLASRFGPLSSIEGKSESFQLCGNSPFGEDPGSWGRVWLLVSCCVVPFRSLSLNWVMGNIMASASCVDKTAWQELNYKERERGGCYMISCQV